MGCSTCAPLTRRAYGWGERIGLAIVIALALLAPMPVLRVRAAVTITVTTTADTIDGCATNGVPPCSLRDAVIYSNAYLLAPTIAVSAGTYRLTLHGKNEDNAQTGDLDVRASVTIQGAGAARTIIDGDGATQDPTADRVFDIFSPNTSAIMVAINDVTITHGYATTSGGGGIAITQHAQVTLTNCVVTANIDALSSGQAAAGGGIYLKSASAPDAGVTLVNTTVSNNESLSVNGAAAYGGGMYTESAPVTIDRSTISGNKAVAGNDSGSGAGDAQGGGLYQFHGDSSVTHSTFAGNEADGGYGGANNGGNAYGGALWVLNLGLTSISNTTLQGNSANAGGGVVNVSQPGIAEGGGIVAEVTPNGFTLTNGTVAGNHATGSPGNGGGLWTAPGDAPTLTNTLIAGNTLPNGGTGPDISGTIASGGHNLVGIADGAGGLTTSDLRGSAGNPLNPQLSSLANNGGPTQTLALLPGSPALNQGDTTTCTNAPVSNQDQRGAPRLQDGKCDIGAYEATPLIAAISPSSGGTAGDSTATIRGGGFATGIAVSFGGVAATVTSVTATSITVKTPPHGAGAVDVTATLGADSATLAGGYTYGIVNPQPSPVPPGSTNGSPAPLPVRRPNGTGMGQPSPQPPLHP